MKAIAPLSVCIKPSRYLLAIQLLAHFVAGCAVLVSTVTPWLVLPVLVLIGASLARLRGAAPVSGLVLGGDNRLQVVGRDGSASDALVQPHTLVLSFLVVLLYRQEGRLRSLTLLADSLAVEDFRQLRLWLRWRSATPKPV